MLIYIYIYIYIYQASKLIKDKLLSYFKNRTYNYGN